jgi:hypothetical protein
VESYPAEVWKSFVFSQHEVASDFSGNPINGNARQALYDATIESRNKQQQSKR